jgi:hypothetical protein
MNQLFPDVKSLADFLIAQNSQPKVKPEKATSQTGFNDWLNFQLLANQTPQNVAPQDIGTQISAPIQAGGAMTNASEAMANWQMGTIALVDPLSAQFQLPPVESISLQGMLAGQLKEMAINQQVPVTLQTDKVATNQALQITNLLNQIGVAQKSPTDSQLFSALTREPNLVNQTIDKIMSLVPASSTETIPRESVNDSASQMAVPENSQDIKAPAQITFTVDQLLNHNVQMAQVKITDTNKLIDNYSIPVKDLQNIVKGYDDNITIQIAAITTKPQAIPAENNVSQNAAVFQSGKPIEHYIVNLQALVASDDSDKVNVLKKLTFSEPARASINNVNRQDTDRTDYGKSSIAEPKVAQTVQPVSSALEDTTDQANSDISLISAAEQLKPLQQTETKEVDGPKSLSAKAAAMTADSKDKNLTDKAVLSTKTDTKASGDQQLRQQVDAKLAAVEGSHEKTRPFVEALTKGVERIDYQKIINQLRANLASVTSNTQLTIMLKPESLGRIKVDFKYNRNTVEATFRVDNPDVKRVLDAEMPRLKSEWNIDTIKVETSTQDTKGNQTPYSDRQYNPKSKNEGSNRYTDDENSSKLEGVASASESKPIPLGLYNRKINIMA